MNIIYILLGVVALVGLWLIYVYNRLVRLKMRSDEALSDIDVQTKRRFDLIPNLIETVKGYMTHENEVLTKVTEARSKVASGGDTLNRAESENMLSSTLKTLFAVSENYPDLKANANFLDLQRELADTENKIQASRRFYNSVVMDLNTAIETFPINFVSSVFGFFKKDFFKAENEEKENVQVKF
ncbi:MAG: hypothetical protein COV57_02155 [Candidatus Liptonbacteria bacterium CG11_big_fil_rev_8_21_14_0_20_35_14]|uniref:LemA family protein n=1 Tax=Candidatus Liptonbacteria bacterium CG11_big_fil_rev_8_21_14_0_20_35_14 TaxID=1974634 RepID=A0A2H0N7L4_9BACT|nr:MAG: hypothetical protein COV57_02155 [Candidatus Liptonbacteria bacterium CG11_big_fil_rev_8_21_14_0_20_35_14]